MEVRMNSNYHMAKILVNERIRAQQQVAAAHRQAKLTAGPKPATFSVRQQVTEQILDVLKAIYAGIRFGLVNDASAYRQPSANR
jgi:hypothetical protein